MSSDKKIIDLSARRLERLGAKNSEHGIAVVGKLTEEVCGVNLLKAAMMAQVIAPLVRTVQRENPAAFKRRGELYRKMINSYDDTTCHFLINTSTAERWKQRPIYFYLLAQKALGKIVPGL
ncbi:MAG: hypothetical protein KGH79_04475 [Patescibacteria group bacterium]|nr:hypothetical protein [Patescibacteria group bacterium]